MWEHLAAIDYCRGIGEYHSRVKGHTPFQQQCSVPGIGYIIYTRDGDGEWRDEGGSAGEVGRSRQRECGVWGGEGVREEWTGVAKGIMGVGRGGGEGGSGEEWTEE